MALTKIVTAFVLTISESTGVPVVGQTQEDARAVGFEFGGRISAIPSEGTGPLLQAFHHLYVAPRTSIRVGIGATNLGRISRIIENVFYHDLTTRYVGAGVDLVHRSERNVYVGGGVGLYHLRGRPRAGSAQEETALKPGGSIFFGRRILRPEDNLLTIEGRLYAIPKFRDFRASGIRATFGIKKFLSFPWCRPRGYSPV